MNTKTIYLSKLAKDLHIWDDCTELIARWRTNVSVSWTFGNPRRDSGLFRYTGVECLQLWVVFEVNTDVEQGKRIKYAGDLQVSQGDLKEIQTYDRTRIHTHARTHTRTHAHTHISMYIYNRTCFNWSHGGYTKLVLQVFFVGLNLLLLCFVLWILISNFTLYSQYY